MSSSALICSAWLFEKGRGGGHQANSEGKHVHMALHTLEVCPAQDISDDGAAKVRERREDKRAAGGETIG